MSDFSTVVELYRISSKPPFDGRSFSATVELDSHVLHLMRALVEAQSACGRFEDIEINGEIIDSDDLESLHISDGDILSYSFIPPKNGAERFYNCIDDFLSINSLRKGIIPDKFYILSEDYYSKEDNKPLNIKKIEQICSIISSLAQIAHFHDTKSESSNYRLVFVKNSDAQSTSVVLETCLTQIMLNVDKLDDKIIKNLLEKKNEDIPHHTEKMGIFRNTIVEYVFENKFDFESLMSHWNEFVQLFENNLSTYMSGFSFHKARKDVATAETEFAEKISKLITELTAKVLSIPVSLIASIGILKLSSKYELLLITLGVILTSTLLHMVLINQEKQLKHICHAKDMAFKPFISDQSGYPAELNSDINNALVELASSQAKCQKTIKSFMYLAWLPSSVASGIFIAKCFI